MRRLVLVLVLLVGVAGCTDGGARTRAAEELGTNLATALTQRSLDGLAIEGGGQSQLKSLLAGVGELPAQVSLAGVQVDGDAATATLDWQWQTPGKPWAYTTTAALSWADGAWTVGWAPTLVEPTLVAGERLDLTTQQGHRGDILGAGGVPLVTHRKVVRFGIDKTKVPAAQAPRSARELARLVGVDPAGYAQRVKKAGAKAFVEAVVLRRADAARISRTTLSSIPGAVAVRDTMPLAPTRDFATALLGRVGPATAEIVAKSRGLVEAGDEVGLSGLQARYEDSLGGTPGIDIAAVGAGPRRPLFTSAAVDGQPLRTTLDPSLQRSAQAALDGVTPASAIVVLRPSTGDILAAASGPGSKGANTATAGRYPPGSTMKVVTALALMRAGLAPSDRIPCTRRVVVDGKPFTNYDAYPASRLGEITLTAAVANSCNTALISQHATLGRDDLAQAAAALGLGVDHDLGFPAYFGQVPPATSTTGAAAAMIGQGRVLASPLAMAAVAASVAEGQAVVPRLLPARDTPDERPAHPLSAKEARALRAMMRAVVTQGTSTFLRDLPGPPVGAKTGTAEFGTRTPLATHAWMIAHQGDVAAAVFVAEGTSGSQTAGPILEEILRAAQ